jgi:hypothetical protein
MVIKEWYEIEYSYIKPGSDKISYRGHIIADTKKEAETLVAIIHGLAKVNKSDYNIKQRKAARKYLGPNRFVKELGNIYKYTKNRVKIK